MKRNVAISRRFSFGSHSPCAMPPRRSPMPSQLTHGLFMPGLFMHCLCLATTGRLVVGMPHDPLTTTEILTEINRIYDEAIACLRADIAEYAASRTLPPVARHHDGSWCYPELRIRYTGEERGPEVGRAFGRLSHPGLYATTITRPRLFADYITEQLDLLTNDYAVELTVGRSRQPIPFPYVLDAGAELGGLTPLEIAQHFPSTELAHIGDEIADGIEFVDADAPL